MRLTERDKKIVLAVYQYRLLSSEQIEVLLFHSPKPHSKRSVCRLRLQLLYHHGFLDRLQLPVVMGEGRSHFVYALDKEGANLTANELGIAREKVGWKPSYNQVKPLFLDHTLAVNTVRVVLALLERASLLTVEQWVDEVSLQSKQYRDKVPYRMRGARIERAFPDGYYAISTPGASRSAHFFLEADQGTMTNTRWAGKIEAYVHFRSSSLAQKHYGTRNFRLLTVTTSQRRLDNLKQTTEGAGGDRYFWFTTKDQVDIWEPEKLLGKVWEVATRENTFSLFV